MRFLHDIINLNNSSDKNINNASNSINLLQYTVIVFLVPINSDGSSMHPRHRASWQLKALINYYKLKQSGNHIKRGRSSKENSAPIFAQLSRPPLRIHDHCNRHANARDRSMCVERRHRLLRSRTVASIQRSGQASDSDQSLHRSQCA